MSILSPIDPTASESFILRHVYWSTRDVRWVAELGGVHRAGARQSPALFQRPCMVGTIRSPCLIFRSNAVDAVIL